MSALRRRIKWDETGTDGHGCIVIESTQDVAEILADNQRCFNATNPRVGAAGFWRNGEGAGWTRVASIPNLAAEAICEAAGVNFYTAEGWAWWKKHIMNDPDYRKFRTAPGWV